VHGILVSPGMRAAPLAPNAQRASEPSGEAPLIVATAPGAGEERPDAAELELIAALGRGEPWAAEEIWSDHAGSIRRLMTRALGPRPEVEDLTQEVFMRVFSRIGVLREPGALREFVFAVGVNVLKRELRRRWVRRNVLLSDSGAVPEIEAPSADPEAREALARCYVILDKLGARERAAFVLRYMEERTLEEVAVGLGVSLRTAKRIVSRASDRVEKYVGSDEGLRNFFDRRGGGAVRPGANTNENTSTRSNVTG
jgi:RNA polymerase sigma-70 factor, ECF subfamily